MKRRVTPHTFNYIVWGSERPTTVPFLSADWRSGDSRLFGTVVTASLDTPPTRGVPSVCEAVSIQPRVLLSRRLILSPVPTLTHRRLARCAKKANKRPIPVERDRKLRSRYHVRGCAHASRRWSSPSIPLQQGIFSPYTTELINPKC